MKHLLILLMAFCISLSGCKQTDQTEDRPETEEQPDVAQNETPQPEWGSLALNESSTTKTFFDDIIGEITYYNVNEGTAEGRDYLEILLNAYLYWYSPANKADAEKALRSILASSGEGMRHSLFFGSTPDQKNIQGMNQSLDPNTGMQLHIRNGQDTMIQYSVLFGSWNEPEMKWALHELGYWNETEDEITPLFIAQYYSDHAEEEAHVGSHEHNNDYVAHNLGLSPDDSTYLKYKSLIEHATSDSLNGPKHRNGGKLHCHEPNGRIYYPPPADPCYRKAKEESNGKPSIFAQPKQNFDQDNDDGNDNYLIVVLPTRDEPVEGEFVIESSRLMAVTYLSMQPVGENGKLELWPVKPQFFGFEPTLAVTSGQE